MEKPKHVVPGVWYELHSYPEDWQCGQPFYLFVGVQVQRIEAMPDLALAKVLPPCHWAVFTHCLGNGGLEGANESMDAWLRAAPWDRAHAIDMQVFGEDFKGPDNPESKMEFWIPVKPGKQGQSPVSG